MSVISRMLRDLEARKAQPRADSGARTLKPGPERGCGRKRRRGDGRRLLAPALAVVLVAVAAGLWWQRAPEMRAGFAQAVDRVGGEWVAWRPGAADDGGPAEAHSGAQPGAEPKQPPARLAAARFDGAGAHATLELRLEGELRGEPGYARQGAAVSLRVPADAAGLEMPAPPAEQEVFKSVALQSNGERGSTIRLQVAEGARFDLAPNGAGLTLTGHLPAEPAASAESEPASSESRSSTAVAEPATATSDAEPAAAATTDDAANGTAPTASAPATAAESAESTESGSTAATTMTSSNADGSASTSREAADDADTPASNGGRAGAMQKEDRSTPAVRAERRYREARNALSAGDLGQARRLLRNALELDPDLHGARDLLVVLHRRAGQAEAARDVLAEGVERAPARVAYAKPYARLLVDAGDLERAARVLADAAGAAGNDAEFHALKAAVAQRRGRHEAAASAYTRALELEADNGRWWLGLGVSLAASDHPGEAAAAFREARRTGSLGSRLDAWARGRIQALEGGNR